MLRSIAVLVPGLGAGLLVLAPVATAAPESADEAVVPSECVINIEDNNADVPLDTCGPALLQSFPLPIAELTEALGLVS